MKPDNNCITLPNGDCVSKEDCMHTVKPRTAKAIAESIWPHGYRIDWVESLSKVLAQHEAALGVLELAIETLATRRCTPGEVTSADDGLRAPGSTAPTTEVVADDALSLAAEDLGHIGDRYRALAADRDRLLAALNLARAEHDRSNAQRDALIEERNSARFERDALAADRYRLAADRDSQQRVAIQRETERDAIAAERDRLARSVESYKWDAQRHAQAEDALARRIEAMAGREPTPEEIEAVHFARRLGCANYGDSVFRAVRDMLLATPASEDQPNAYMRALAEDYRQAVADGRIITTAVPKSTAPTTEQIHRMVQEMEARCVESSPEWSRCQTIRRLAAERDRLAQEVKDAHHARQWINNAHLETSASRDALSRRIEAMRVREPTADDLIQFKQSWNDHSRNPYVKAWLHVRDALLATPEAGDAE